MLDDFQKDCVLSAIQKINKSNGCIIADILPRVMICEFESIMDAHEIPDGMDCGSRL